MLTKGSRSAIIGDRWLIFIALILVGITVWNSRYALMPTLKGYTRYTEHGITFLYPDDVNIWEVAIYDDGSDVQDGSRTISEDWGTVGWNSGNVDHERPGRKDYYQESSVIWLTTDPPENNVKLTKFYTALGVSAERCDREDNMTKGETGTLTHRSHDVVYEYFNYTAKYSGRRDMTYRYGIVAGFYCHKTGRTIELYYMDLYDSDPVYDKETLFNTFKFYLNSIQCH